MNDPNGDDAPSAAAAAFAAAAAMPGVPDDAAASAQQEENVDAQEQNENGNGANPNDNAAAGNGHAPNDHAPNISSNALRIASAVLGHAGLPQEGDHHNRLAQMMEQLRRHTETRRTLFAHIGDADVHGFEYVLSVLDQASEDDGIAKLFRSELSEPFTVNLFGIVESQCYTKVNIFQALCMCGQSVPANILEDIVAIDERVLTTPTGRVRERQYYHRPSDETAREPFNLACLLGHADVLRYIIQALGNRKAQNLAKLDDPEYDVTMTDLNWAKFMMPAFWKRYANAEFAVTNLFRPFLQSIVNSKTPEDMSQALRNCWDKTVLILDVLFCNASKNRPFPSLVLHKLFSRSYDSNILSVIPWLILSLYPDQARAEDVNGNLPLHAFCQNDAGRKLFQFELTKEFDNLLTDDDKTMLDQLSPKNLLPTLLSRYPEATKRANRRGRLPIHEAAANPWFDWEDVQVLAQADPDASDVIDPVTGLFPFMISASAPPIHKSGYDDVTKIFILLRENPENVRQFDALGKRGDKRDGSRTKCDVGGAKSSAMPGAGKHPSRKPSLDDDDFFSGPALKRASLQSPPRKSLQSSTSPARAAASPSRYGVPSKRNDAPIYDKKRSSVGAKKRTLEWNDDSEDDDLMDDRDELW